MDELKIGNRWVSVHQAKDWVRDYTADVESREKPYGYPWYDAYDTGGSSLLVDGDLLAPVLLNVRPSITAYRSLKSMVPELNAVLMSIAPGASLLETQDLADIGRLFAPLDDAARSHGVQGTTLAKVLHRKRPHFVPLYDSKIWNCYCTRSPLDGDVPRIAAAKDRTWAEYMMLITAAIRDDINEQIEAWREVHDSIDVDPQITLLRCFDIVAWKAGDDPRSGESDGSDTTEERPHT